MKTLKILTITALLTSFSIAQQKEALILGVSDYMGTKYDLNGVKKDVPRMERLFRSWGFNVKVINSSDSMNLESYLSNYTNLSANDNFIFYYTGHGYHTKDKNGDEVDGEDEALVLSDGVKNKLFIDDTLFGYLNAIKAKKLVLFDSCHSGTVFKAFGDKPKPKTINESQVSGIIKTKAFRPMESRLTKGEYIVLSASQDREESLDTVDGGMFTNAFLHQIENGGLSNRLMNLRQNMENEIVQNAKRTDSPPHHPQLSASSNELKYTSIDKFFMTKSTPPITKKTISIIGKKSFREGELLSFKVDTHGNSGYLTIFSIENGEPFIMTQTSKPVKGILNFQKDFNINPPIECYKSCGSCPQEVSSVYVILSATPLTKNIMKTKGLKINGANSSVGMRAFRRQTNEAYEPIIAKSEFTIH